MNTTLLFYRVLFCAVFFTPIISFSQVTGRITGTVSDSATNAPVYGATVQLIPSGSGTLTNAFGKFALAPVSPGSYTVVVRQLGYFPQSRSVTIKDGAAITIDFSLSFSTFVLKEVVTTGNIDPASAIGIINKVDMQLRPVNSAQDLLRMVPGLFIAQHAGGGKAEQIFLRGFDIDHGTDFAVSVDGMPVNMVSHAHGQGYADFHFVIPETIDQLSVSKGPFNAKYGDLATAGAGSFSTLSTLKKSEVKLEYGQFNTQRVMAMIDLLRGKHFLTKRNESAYIAAEYNFSDSYFESPQHFKRVNVFGKYTGMLGERTLLSFSGSTFSSSWDASGQVPERAITARSITRFGAIDNTEGGETDRSNANIVLTTSTKNGGILKNQVYYGRYNFNLYSNFTFFLNDSVFGDQINQRDQGRNIYGYTGTYEKKGRLGNKELTSVIGLSTRIDQSDLALLHSVKRVVIDTFSSGKLYQQNAALYVDETVRLTNRFSVNLSARLDFFDFKYDSRLSDTLSGRKQKSIVNPKMNLTYDLSANAQMYVRVGSGFHSNDARSVVQGNLENTLARAIATELGSTFLVGKSLLINAALWTIDLENELVYVGDEAIVEINGATRRLGADISMRLQLTSWLFADADFNYNHGRFKGLPEGENFIPLAPSFTSTGGISIKQDKGFNASLRYRYMDSRPANEDNTVVAKGYFIMDAVVNYTRPKYQVGLSVQNLLDVDWNEAQFDTESRLKNETQSVNELHFTPGTPFFLKGTVSYFF